MTDGRAAATDTPQRPSPDPGTGATAGTPRWVRRWALLAALVIAVGAVVVWRLGGFETRKDYVASAPGEAIDAGNLVFTLTDATAQQQASGEWDVVVNGTVSNPNDTSLAPVLGDSGNLAVVRARGTTSAVLSSFELGGAWQRNVVAPGGQPVRLAAGFTFPAGVDFGDTIICGVFPMEYSDNSVLGVANGAKVWNPDSYARGHTVTLPLTILPPQG